MKKLELIKQSELINKEGTTRQYRYYKLGEKRFKVVCDIQNGNGHYHNHISQYDGTQWNTIDTALCLSMKSELNYVNSTKCLIYLKEFFEKAEKHIVEIYYNEPTVESSRLATYL